MTKRPAKYLAVPFKDTVLYVKDSPSLAVFLRRAEKVYQQYVQTKRDQLERNQGGSHD